MESTENLDASNISKEPHFLSFSVQRLIYNLLIINLTIISYLLYRPHYVSSIIKQKRIYAPFMTLLFILLALFWQHTYHSYQELISNASPGAAEDDVQLLKWKVQYHKL